MLSKTVRSILLCSGLLFAGCANFAAFQTADVVEQGETNVTVGVTYTTYVVDFFDDDGNEAFIVPALFLSAQHGLTERLQLHGNLWIPLGTSIGIKYQMIGSAEQEGFGLSAGFDVGYLNLTSSAEEDTISRARFDFYFPLFIAHDFTESISLYLVPKYIGSLYSGDNSQFTSTFTTALGIKLGFLFLEGSYGRDFATESVVSHIGAAVHF